jgi:hypothetical protein
MFANLAEFQTFLPFSLFPLHHHSDLIRHYYSFGDDSSITNCKMEILPNEWQKKPNNNMQPLNYQQEKL